MIERREEPIAVVVVSHQSAAVLAGCLDALPAAAPRRGVRVCVVDNASTDDSVAIASARLGESSVLRLGENRGFAAGVNAGLAALPGTWYAVLNPDTATPAGALDALADVLEANPRAGLAGPRVRARNGRPEASVGRFPSLTRERAHTWLLDRLLGFEGRLAPFPARTGPVDWVSGCAWMLRAEALRQVGPLDEGYFMYYEDVDYCRRLHDAGWEVLAVPEIAIVHGLGEGSSGSAAIPADGGPALLRYFEKFHAEVPVTRVRALLMRGWRLRLAWRRLRAALGDRRSARLARRYRIALDALIRR